MRRWLTLRNAAITGFVLSVLDATLWAVTNAAVYGRLLGVVGITTIVLAIWADDEDDEGKR